MYNVLVVDDDRTCLSILKANLQRWCYQVTAVNHAYDALCNLRARPYDLVLSDVHMPHMDGFELQRQINREFCLPVVLISSDSTPEVIYKGIERGAQYFLVKPIVADDLKNLWQFSEWWKWASNNRASPICESNRTSQENAEGNVSISSDNILTARAAKRFVWTHKHHTRFVEALLVVGYHEAVPRTILEFMNVPELRREQVASHLQKYRQFINRVLDGKVDLETSHWIDVNCYSNFVSGNPHLMLINQLRSEKRDGKSAASYRSGGAKSYIFTSTNHFETSVTATYHNNFYSTQAFNMGGQGNNSVYSGHNINDGQEGIAQQDMSTGILLNSNQFGNTSALLGGGQMTNQSFFNEHNPQLRTVKHGPNTDISFGANQFGNAIAANEHQLGAGKMTVPNLFKGHNLGGGQQLGAGGMTNQKSWFTNNVVLSPDNSLLGPNQTEGNDGDDYWEDVMINIGIADDKDVGVADEFGDNSDDDDENSRDSDDDADYNPEKEC